MATVRALKYHSGVALGSLAEPRVAAVIDGLDQLRHHVAIVQRLRMRPAICINAFGTDEPNELAVIADAARAWGVPAAVSTAFAAGGAGARELAGIVADLCRAPSPEITGGLYSPEMPLDEKLRAVARGIYGASEVTFTDAALHHLKEFEARGFGQLPVCVAKTQYSLTDQPHIRGVPEGFAIHIRDVEVRAGAGFILALAGDMMTMPALPPRPRAWEIDLAADGSIRGVA